MSRCHINRQYTKETSWTDLLVFPSALNRLNVRLTHLPVRQHVEPCLPWNSLHTCCLLLPVLYTFGPFRLWQHIYVLRHQLCFQSPSTAHHFGFHDTPYTLWFLLRFCLVPPILRLFHPLLIRMWRPLLTGHLSHKEISQSCQFPLCFFTGMESYYLKKFSRSSLNNSINDFANKTGIWNGMSPALIMLGQLWINCMPAFGYIWGQLRPYINT